MEVAYSAKSDTGCKRTTNEDRYGVDHELGLYVVCDGMGGQNAGEVASALAVETIRTHCRDALGGQTVERLGPCDPTFFPQTNLLASAICHANQVIYQEAQTHLCYHKMGTTVVSALLKGRVLSIAHVGDSRLYLIRGDRIESLTEDHSLVMEQVRRGILTEAQAECSPQRHVLTRALGLEPTVAVELREFPVLDGDRFVLCSDGLTRMVQPQEIQDVLRRSSDLQAASRQLIEMANARGGADNTTVVLVAVEETLRRSLWERIRHRFLGEASAVMAKKEEPSWQR